MSEPVTRHFTLPTGGSHPGTDAIAIMCEVLDKLPANEKAAAIQYVIDKFGYREQRESATVRRATVRESERHG